jgi:hypothetical protein
MAKNNSCLTDVAKINKTMAFNKGIGDKKLEKYSVTCKKEYTGASKWFP